MKIMLASCSKMVNEAGGMQKVFANFANEMEERGHFLSIVYTDGRDGDFFYSVNHNVHTYDLCRYGGKLIKMPISLKIKREIYRAFSTKNGRGINDEFHEKCLLNNFREILDVEKPDVIVSFHPLASKLVICDIKSKIPVITMSHGDPEDYFHTYPEGELPAIEHSAVNQVLVPSFAEHITKRYPKCRVEVIGNVVPAYKEQAKLELEKDQYKIIFLGRLVRNHKRPHLLIEAFSKVADKFPNWVVEIWGATDSKKYNKSMQNFIDKNNLQNRVFFKGNSVNVETLLHSGDIFAFPSAYEGWGMAMTEAMSMGLPVIAYKSCVAVNELVRNGENGFLCEDGVDDFADKLSVLMSDASLRCKMGKCGREDMKAYPSQVIWDKWEKLMMEIANL